MNPDLYAVIALAARYWFAALAILIVFRGWRASVKDNRSAKILRDLTMRASCIGELVITRDRGDGSLLGERYPVPRECMLGSSGAADIRINRPWTRKRHLWLEQRVGCLALRPIGRAEVTVPGQDAPPFAIADGGQFLAGDLTMMMVFYDAQSAQSPDVVLPDEPDEDEPRGLVDEDAFYFTYNTGEYDEDDDEDDADDDYEDLNDDSDDEYEDIK